MGNTVEKGRFLTGLTSAVWRVKLLANLRFSFSNGALMKILLGWLGDYITIEHSAGEIAEILSGLGLACEGIKHLGDDVVIDVEVTSNRGDCLSYIGIARELASVTGKELKIPAIELDELDEEVGEFASVEIIEPDLCGRYTARIVEGAKVGASPDWMKKRLEAVGLRSVNNVVDSGRLLPVSA
jgi:phenylalanyl-tRNA synthetase beta chain